MPKQLLEIKRFNVGTLLTPDSKDIPPEAASYSLNIDSVTEDGKLKGIPDDESLKMVSGLVENLVYLDDEHHKFLVAYSGGAWLQ